MTADEIIPGTRLKLIKMVDTQAPPVGTEGTVQFIDGIGTIHIHWDNGSTLGLVPGEDEWQVVVAKSKDS